MQHIARLEQDRLHSLFLEMFEPQQDKALQYDFVILVFLGDK